MVEMAAVSSLSRPRMFHSILATAVAGNSGGTKGREEEQQARGGGRSGGPNRRGGGGGQRGLTGPGG